MENLPISMEEYQARCARAVKHHTSKRVKLNRLTERLWQIGPGKSVTSMAKEIDVSHVTCGNWLEALKAAGLYSEGPIKGLLQNAAGGGGPPEGNDLQRLIERIENEPDADARNRYIAILEQDIESGLLSPRDRATAISTIAQIRPNIKAPEKQVNITYLVGKESLDQVKKEIGDDLLWLAENKPMFLATPDMAPVRKALLAAIPEAEIEVDDDDTPHPDRDDGEAGAKRVYASPGRPDEPGPRRVEDHGQPVPHGHEGPNHAEANQSRPQGDR